jgi:hypothetical protein
VNVSNNSGETALHVAIANSNAALALFLLQVRRALSLALGSYASHCVPEPLRSTTPMLTLG